MYRIFCESCKNYMNQYNGEVASGEYRYKIAHPIALIGNPEAYAREKQRQSGIYKQLSDLLVYVRNNLDRYPKLKAFIWTLESRGIIGEYFGVASDQDMEEQAKLMSMFLDLIYW